MQRKLWALLAMLSVVCFAGIGRTGNTVSGKVQLMDYTPSTGVVLGYPDGQPPLGWYKATQHTEFLPGPPSFYFPPSPCRGLDHAWNVIVRFQPSNDALETRRTQALLHILGQLSRNQCNAVIDRSANGTPADIVKISPTP